MNASITSADGAARGDAAVADPGRRRMLSGVRYEARGVAPGAADEPLGTSRVESAVRPRAEAAMCSSTREASVCIIDII